MPFDDLKDIMKEFRDQNFLCDFTLVVQGVEIKAHRLILAIHSHYFKSLFSLELRESQEGRVVIDDISPAIMQLLLDYFYTSEFQLNEDIVQDLMLAANKLQVEPVLKKCCDYLAEGTTMNNCLGILNLANRLNLSELTKNTLTFCLTNFESLIEEEEFLHIDKEILESIVSNDNLVVSDEYNVYCAIVKWILQDEEKRKPSFNDLVSHVRFVYIRPLTKLLELQESPLARNSKEIYDLIYKSIAFLCLGKFGECQLNNFTTGPKFSARTHSPRIYVVGGTTNQCMSVPDVERYNPYTEEWEEISSMSKSRCGAGAVILDGFLYAIGGYDGQDYLKCVEKYDLRLEKWTSDKVRDMSFERNSLGVVSLNGNIFAIGGQTASGSCDNVEVYYPLENKWKLGVPMKEKRIGAGVAVLKGLIYVIGGARHILSERTILNTVECMDPKTGEWSDVSPMQTRRKHLGCAAYDGKIYVVGGRGEESDLNTVECYDPVHDRWEFLPSMIESRSGLGLVELEGLLYAVGGRNGRDLLDNMVEVFHPKEHLWSIRNPMIVERLGGGICSTTNLNDER